MFFFLELIVNKSKIKNKNEIPLSSPKGIFRVMGFCPTVGGKTEKAHTSQSILYYAPREKIRCRKSLTTPSPNVTA